VFTQTSSYKFLKIPREEIFEPKTPIHDAFDLSSLPTSATFRERSLTISNGHAARLKTLMEAEAVQIYKISIFIISSYFLR